MDALVKILLQEVDRIKDVIQRLDDDLITSQAEIEKARVYLERSFDPRRSMLMLRANLIKDKLGDGVEDQRMRRDVDAAVLDVVKLISESGYIGANLRMPVKPTRGRPSSKSTFPKNSIVRGRLKSRRFRFLVSEDLSNLKDVEHNPPDYKAMVYEGMTAEKASEVIEKLLSAAENKASEGWVKSESWWRGAFQNKIYKRFKDEQIEVGSTKNGHNGYWRFITNVEFDGKSTKGRFRRRVSVNAKSD